MGLGGAPSSSNGSGTRSQPLSEVDQPLTDVQLVDCANKVVAKLITGRFGMVRMVEHEEIESMAREAVILADRRYQPCGASRHAWAINKGMFMVMDMMRVEAGHTVCLSAGEFRGSVRDKNGNRIEPRGRFSVDRFSSNRGVNDRETHPFLFLKATEPPIWLNVYNEQLYERFECALQRLPDKRAAVAFRLTIWHEWTQEDVADLFGVTPSRVSQMLTRSRGRLCAEFSDLSSDRRAA